MRNTTRMMMMMQLPTLQVMPKWLYNAPGTLLEGFENTADWTVGGGELALVADTVNFQQGTQSIKTSLSALNSGRLTKDNLGWDLSALSYLTISYYVENAAVTPVITLYLSNTNATFTHCFQKNLTVKTGWNYYQLRQTDFVVTGSPSWASAINSIRLYTEQTAGQTSHVSFDTIYRDPVSIPSVMFMFDDWDGDGSIYSIAYPYMKARRIPGTFYVVSDYLVTTLLAHCTDMHNNGWDIANHTKDHTDLTTLTAEQQGTEFTAAQTVLEAAGFTRASKHVSYPGGAQDANTVIAMNATGMLTGRGAVQGYVELLPPNALTNLHITRSLGNTISLATAEADVDTAITRGGMAVFLIHSLVETPTNGTQWGIADFRSLVDYVVSKRLHCLTISQMYSLFTTATLVNRPI